LEVGSLAGHSVVVRTKRWKGEEGGKCHAVFSVAGEGFAAEMFSRVGGEIWLGGLNGGEVELPEGNTGSARVVEGAADKVREVARRLLGGDVEIVKEGLCFRPVTMEGLPIVGRVSDDDLGPGVATRPGADGGKFMMLFWGPEVRCCCHGRKNSQNEAELTLFYCRRLRGDRSRPLGHFIEPRNRLGGRGACTRPTVECRRQRAWAQDEINIQTRDVSIPGISQVECGVPGRVG
jgi:hypothetical protein